MLQSDTRIEPVGAIMNGAADGGHGERPLARIFSGPAAYVVQTPWKPLGGFVVSAGIFAGATIAVVIAVVEAWLVIGLPNHVDFEHITLNTGLQLIATLVQQVTMIGLTLWAATSYSGSPERVLALGRPAQGAKVYAMAFGVFLLAMVGMTLVSNALDPGANQADVNEFKKMFNSMWWPLALFVVGVGAPVSEELLFRGFLFPSLANSRLGLLGAAVLTSLIFAVVHPYSITGRVEVFLIGLLLCWLLVRTGSLRVTMFAHALNNTVQAVLLLVGADRWL